ncbi:MAG TPA: hypothetical protein VMF55_01920 [Solirubrobacterales bacterium]|nr:hypothetical protein [Solirubrobacterales bacterium]
MARIRGSIAVRSRGAGTRGGLGRIAAMAIGLAVVLLLAAAGEARGGTYRVVQCGWGVGAELDPTYPAAEGVAFALNSAACLPPPGAGAAAMRFEAGPAADGTFGLARARWAAPAGASFRGAHLTWSGDARWGNWQGLGFDVGDQFKVLALATQGSVSAAPTPIDLAVDGPAWGFEAWFQCAFSLPSSLPCVRSAPSTMRLGGLIFTLEDAEAPQVRLGGTAAPPGWQRGTAALELDAADAGAGVAAEAAWIDGAPALDAPVPCSAQAIEGELRGTRMQPCPPTASRTIAIDTTRLADGPHALRGCATDFSGGRGCADLPVQVDNSPPAISFAAAVEGEVAATVSDRFSGPAAGTISVRRAEAEAWTDLPTTFAAEADGQATLTARLPDLSAGVYRFRATATDAAGNSGAAQLRVAGSPSELRRQAADGRGAKGGDSRGGGPSPRRRATRLAVRLVAEGRGGRGKAGAGALADRGAPGSRAAGAGLAVDYGTAAALRGRLTDARGGAVAGRPVAVTVRQAAGLGRPERHRVMTDPRGRFALRLPPGTSRRVTAAFRGGRGLAPAPRRSLTLRVRAGVTLSAVPTELRTGDSVRLRGRVRLGPAGLSGRGKLIAIQYLERATRRWRPALVVRADARGRFDTTYRFRYVTGVALIRLRATAPAEGGWPFARGSSAPVTVTVSSG